MQNSKYAISLIIKNVKVYIIAIISCFSNDTHETIASSDTMYDYACAYSANETPPPSPIPTSSLARYVSPWIYQNKKISVVQLFGSTMMLDGEPNGKIDNCMIWNFPPKEA